VRRVTRTEPVNGRNSDLASAAGLDVEGGHYHEVTATGERWDGDYVLLELADGSVFSWVIESDGFGWVRTKRCP
jgi:hypothetical protein